MKLKEIALFLAAASSVFAASDAPERLNASAEVLTEIMAAPDKGIPQDLMDKAACIVVVPGLKKGAFIIGGKYGKGFINCRRENGVGWSAPAAVRVEGGSFGFQIGGSSTDVVMLVMNEHGMKQLDKNKFTLGGDASIAAGPVGRTTTANTDAYMTAEILSWSRTRGVFAGISLSGATLRPDRDANREIYGEKLDSKELLMSGRKPPAAAEPLIHELDRYSMRKVGN